MRPGEGKVIHITDHTNPAGYGVEAEYDRYGQVLGLKDETGPLLKNRYDPQGNLLELVEATGADSTFAYNWDGKPTRYTDQNGQTRTLGFEIREFSPDFPNTRHRHQLLSLRRIRQHARLNQRQPGRYRYLHIRCVWPVVGTNWHH